MKVYGLDNCLKVYKKLKIVDDCFNSKSPTLSQVQRDKGEEFTALFLASWLVNLNEILNLKRPMSDHQIILCVTTILNDYSNLKIADLTLLFKRIMAGEFGEFYESISIPKVLTFFRDYTNDRLNRAEELSIVQHNDFASDKTFNVSKNIRRIWNGTPSK